MSNSESKIVDEAQLVNFKLGSEEYGIDIASVQEIIKLPDITRVPWAPDFVEGVVNLRGTILPVIDTRRRFSMESAERGETNRIVVASVGAMTVGMIVDSVSEVLRVESKDIEPPPPIITGTNADYLIGIGKLGDGSRLVSLLDLESVFRLDMLEEQFSGLIRRKSRRIEDDKTDIKSGDEVQLVSFQLGGEEYAVDIDVVEEIIRIPHIRRIPDVPDFVKGVISLRGKVLPVLSLRSRFGMDDSDLDTRGRVLIVRSKDASHGGRQASFGLIVDFVNEVLTLPLNAVDPPPSILSSDSSGYIRGMGKLDQGKRMLILLNVDVLVEQFGGMQISTTGASRNQAEETEGEKKRMVDERQLVSFKLGREEFGVDIMNVQEIVRMSDITEIPGAPYYIRGVANLRGEILPVLDLRKRFGMDESERTDSNRIVVVNIDKNMTGLVVDSVSEVLQFNIRDVEPQPRIISGVDIDFIDGICKMDGGERFIILLNLRNILNIVQHQGDEASFDGSESGTIELQLPDGTSYSEPSPEKTVEMVLEFSEVSDGDAVEEDSPAAKSGASKRTRKKS